MRPRRAQRAASWRVVLAVLALVAAGCTDQGAPPAVPTPSDVPPPYRAASTCGGCHPQHLREWESSTHAYGGSDPVMLAMSEIARQEAGEEAGGSCRACHSPALVRQERWLAAGNTPSADHPLEDLSEDGVSCDLCHSIDLIPPAGSIDFLADVDPRGAKLGGIADPVPNVFHESRLDDSFRTSVQCRSCHQVHAANGTGLENTYAEWDRSILSGMGVECQDCHMPSYPGPAAVDGPVRTVHRHSFPGPDYAWEPFRGIDRTAQREAIRELLERSVVAVLDVPPTLPAASVLPVRVAVTNAFTGHSIPSGVSFAREMWVELVVRDGLGREVHLSGRPQPDGDLPDDPDLVKFGSVMRDAEGNPTFFTWRATSIDESGLIEYGQTRTGAWDVPIPPATPGPLTVEAALRFRPVPPALLRMLDLERLLPIEIFDMWRAEETVVLE